MHPVIKKTLGGLSPQYYFRQFIFGLALSAIVIYFATQDKSMSVDFLIFTVINTFLYPYSRFVYESIVDFIMGENVFFVNTLFMLISKYIMMVMCYLFALFIAPIGLAYLYYHHSKAER